MRFEEFKNHIAAKVFTVADILKIQPYKNSDSLKTQIYRWIKKGYIKRIKKGVYVFSDKAYPLKEEVYPYYLANLIYQPSYVSLESALFFYGIIPDVIQRITSVTPTTTKEFKTSFGVFSYHKITKSLYFGYSREKVGKYYVKIATKEKALLDFFYLRKIKKVDDLRIDFSKIDFSKYKEYSKSFPLWVQKII